MKIVYVANIRFPTEKAHGLQIAKTCEALVRLGHEVELVIPDRITSIREDVFTYYGVSAPFAIVRLPVWDTVRYGTFGFLLESLLFARAVRRYLRGKRFDLLYGRDELVLARLPAPYVWESHTGAWGRSAHKVARRAKRIVVISRGLKDFYVEKGVPEDALIIAPDGIDLEQFAHPQSKEDARTRLGLPLDKKIVMYLGRLDGWKGVDTLLEASQLLPKDMLVTVIGGESSQIAELSVRYPGVRFLGHRPYKELPDNQAAADVLVLPNTANSMISALYTSPLKLFTYMASGIACVASDLPSIREVVSDSEFFFAKPDDPASFANLIREAVEHPSDAEVRAQAARVTVKQYEWRTRAQLIVEGIGATKSQSTSTLMQDI